MMDERPGDRDPRATLDEPGGDAACWLHLVCPECGAVVTGEDGHRPDCDRLDARQNSSKII